MTLDKAIDLEYSALLIAAKKIANQSEKAHDLLHYALEQFLLKPNREEIAESGALRFYIVRIMMTQWNSSTSPFYLQTNYRAEYQNSHYKEYEEEVNLNQNQKEESYSIEESEKIDHENKLDIMLKHLQDLNWYDRELFKTFVQGNHTYSSLARETKIPRTSIARTIKEVKQALKFRICQDLVNQE